MQLQDISNISVIGAGTMGHGIGLTYALGGYEVALNDISNVILSNAMSHIRDDLKTFADSGQDESVKARDEKFIQLLKLLYS